MPVNLHQAVRLLTVAACFFLITDAREEAFVHRECASGVIKAKGLRRRGMSMQSDAESAVRRSHMDGQMIASEDRFEFLGMKSEPDALMLEADIHGRSPARVVSERTRVSVKCYTARLYTTYTRGSVSHAGKHI